MPTHRVIRWSLLMLLVSVAARAEGRFALHFISVSCVIGPCPGWEATDLQTGETFDAVVDFSALSSPPARPAELVVEGNRVRMTRPNGGGTYDSLHVTGLLQVAPGLRGDRH
jgi:hypothetical protein